jgi:hypothetical protein
MLITIFLVICMAYPRVFQLVSREDLIS